MAKLTNTASGQGHDGAAPARICDDEYLDFRGMNEEEEEEEEEEAPQPAKRPRGRPKGSGKAAREGHSEPIPPPSRLGRRPPGRPKGSTKAAKRGYCGTIPLPSQQGRRPRGRPKRSTKANIASSRAAGRDGYRATRTARPVAEDGEDTEGVLIGDGRRRKPDLEPVLSTTDKALGDWLTAWKASEAHGKWFYKEICKPITAADQEIIDACVGPGEPQFNRDWTAAQELELERSLAKWDSQFDRMDRPFMLPDEDLLPVNEGVTLSHHLPTA